MTSSGTEINGAIHTRHTAAELLAAIEALDGAVMPTSRHTAAEIMAKADELFPKEGGG